MDNNYNKAHQDFTASTSSATASMFSNTLLWDCGSSLYDSFELKSFKRQLDSAIAGRSFSMPRLTEPVAAEAFQQQAQVSTKKPFKISRSINKFIRSVFRLKTVAAVPMQTRLLVDLQLSGKLTTIPEVSEKCVESPEVDPLATKTMSERFAATTVAAAAAATLEVPCT